MSIYGKWAIKAAINAKQLAEESMLLQRHNYKARAYYLAHMSVEESSKSIVLYAAHVTGAPIFEFSKVKRLLSDHKEKIEAMIDIATSINTELSRNISPLKGELVSYINDKKNGTMYVSANSTSIVTPEEIVSKLDISPHIKLAEVLSDWAVEICADC